MVRRDIEGGNIEVTIEGKIIYIILLLHLITDSTIH